MNLPDNVKLILKETSKYGKAVFAKEEIEKDEVIAIWNGLVYKAENNSDLPNDFPMMVADHAIQFEKNKLTDSKGIARCINHYC